AFHLRGLAAALVIFQLSACGGSDPSGDEPLPNEAAESQESAGGSGVAEAASGGTAAPASAAGGGSVAGSAPQAFTLGIADLDAYERGLQREIEILQSARERFASAGDDEARLE